MSHLPDSIVSELTTFVNGLDDELQTRGHNVKLAMERDPAFDERYVQSPLRRSLICNISSALFGPKVEVLANGGCELRLPYEGIERRFRLRKAVRDRRNLLDVRVSSDSILAKRVFDPKLPFWNESPELEQEYAYEQWVLAYVISPLETVSEIWAGRPVGFANDHAPYRLVLADLTVIPLHITTPPAFTAEVEDLELEKEQEHKSQDDVG